jgi:hypothetical protein
MADPTYQPKVYRDEGGNRINVISGGTLSVESGSVCELAGVVRHGLIHATVKTTADAINAGGLTVCSASSGVQPVFHLAAPGAAGVVTYLVGAGGSTLQTISTTGGGQTIGATGTKVVFSKTTYGGAMLVASATGRWELTGSYGANVAIG